MAEKAASVAQLKLPAGNCPNCTRPTPISFQVAALTKKMVTKLR
jgi:hypothetical protein